MPLHKKLGIALEDCGFVTDARPFSVHATQMRNYRGPAPENINLSTPWRVEKWVLVESITYKEGVKYQLLKSCPNISDIMLR